MSNIRKRYVPDRKFPSYAFVPGYFPHPNSHPEGHSYNKQEVIIDRFVIEKYLDSKEYLYGFDLFNHGYYWESHEAWENVWRTVEKESLEFNFLKALIKLSAAAVKIRQGQPQGAILHSKMAEKIFKSIKEKTGNPYFAGLDIDKLIIFSMLIYECADEIKSNPEKTVEIIFEDNIYLEE